MLYSNWRGKYKKVRFDADMLSRHLFVVGGSGTGKSLLLKSIALSLIHQQCGVAVLDPHGDMVKSLYTHLPRNSDVVWFDPTNGHLIGLNILDVPHPSLKDVVPEEAISIFKSIWADSWGMRMEKLMRASFFTLAGRGTLMDIHRLLTDRPYRDRLLKGTSPSLLDAWKEIDSWTHQYRQDGVAAVMNRLGILSFNENIRFIVGQKRSRLDMREVLDGKVFLANLSKGEIGEEISSLLMSIIAGKLYFAAMSRERRKPFFIIVDEAQTMAGSILKKILSEARKFQFGTALANQYLTQLPEDVRDAVLSNAGMNVVFRVSAEDAKTLDLAGFDTYDITHLENYHAVVKMDGHAFSAVTKPSMFPFRKGREEKMKQVSRRKYGVRKDVLRRVI
jgi:DNA helicase HerA-like ATPase